MTEIVACPRCQRQLLLPAEHLGKPVQCPACKLEFLAETDIPMARLAPEPSTAITETPQLPLQLRNNRGQFAQGLGRGMGPALERQAPILEWNASDVRQVKLTKPGEAVVIARHQALLPGVSIKMRWWVIKQPNGWKIYD